MDKKVISFWNSRLFCRMRLQWLLLASVVVTCQASYISHFKCNSHPSSFPVSKVPCLKGRAVKENRHSSLYSTIEDDPSVDYTPSECVDNAHSCSTTHITFSGGGIFFYHQAGVINYLRARYDLSTCTFSGASAGALTATLTAANVDFYEATDLALKMAKDVGVWDRKGGLQGIWGPLIEEWLDLLLPPCIDTLQDRISLLVTPVPSFGKTKVSRFENRDDLIRCNMASVHLPWFLDGKLTSNFRGRPHIDGSFLSNEDDYLPNFEKRSDTRTPTIILDWSKDPGISSKGGLDIVKALSPDGIYGLMEQGKVYGKLLEDQGTLKSLKKLP